MPFGDLLPAVGDSSIRVLAPAAFAVALLWSLRRRSSAPLEHAVWSVVLAGMLLTPFLSPLLPPVPLRILPPESPAPAAAPIVSQPPTPVTHATPPAGRPAPQALEVRTVSSPDWRIWAGWLYFAVAFGFIARMGVGYVLARRLAGGAAPPNEPALQSLLDELVNTSDMTRAPVLLESDRVRVPVSVGWLRPRLLLPPDWREWPEWKRRAVLAHELSHVRRGDWLTSLAASLNKCVFWFHPLSWWLERKLRILSEQACDGAALESAVPRDDYAAMLVEMASAVASHGGRVVWQPQAITGGSSLSERIDRVLAWPHRSSRLSRASWTAVALCGIPLFLAAAALQLERRDVRPAAEESARTMDEMQLLIEGWNLKPADVQRLEQQVERNPDDLESRALLLSHYFQNAIRHPRVEHIFWLIEHHPESWVHDTRGAGFVLVPGNPLNTEADYEKARNLWLLQLERYPDNENVLRRVIRFVMMSDRALAEQLIQGARRSSPRQHEWTTRLAGLYARAIDAVETTPPADARTNPSADPAFAAHARDVLETSNDPELVGLAGEWFAGGVRLLPSDPEVSAWFADTGRRRAGLAEKFLRRAQSLDPDNPRWREQLQQLNQQRRP